MTGFFQKLFAMLLLSVLIVACSPDAGEQPVLRVHNVSALELSELDNKLNLLLEREDLALKGRVTLVDDGRLAVNAPPYVQDQITGILAELEASGPQSDVIEDAVYQVRYWLLAMTPGEQSEDMPAVLTPVLESIEPEFPGYVFSVQDFIESFHYGPARSEHLRSGAGSDVMIRSMRPASAGLHAQFRLQAENVGQSGSRHLYNVNRLLVDGQPMVLGRSFGTGGEGQPIYQILVAQADRIDQQG